MNLFIHSFSFCHHGWIALKGLFNIFFVQKWNPAFPFEQSFSSKMNLKVHEHVEYIGAIQADIHLKAFSIALTLTISTMHIYEGVFSSFFLIRNIEIVTPVNICMYYLQTVLSKWTPKNTPVRLSHDFISDSYLSELHIAVEVSWKCFLKFLCLCVFN